MPGFTFAFSYDKLSRVAWLTLSGVLDTAGLQRLRGLLRTIVGALAPGGVYIDVRDANLPGVPSGAPAIRALRWFPALSVTSDGVDGRVCDMVLLFPPGTPGEPGTWRQRVSIPPQPATARASLVDDPGDSRVV